MWAELKRRARRTTNPTRLSRAALAGILKGTATLQCSLLQLYLRTTLKADTELTLIISLAFLFLVQVSVCADEALESQMKVRAIRDALILQLASQIKTCQQPATTHHSVLYLFGETGVHYETLFVYYVWSVKLYS